MQASCVVVACRALATVAALVFAVAASAAPPRAELSLSEIQQRISATADSFLKARSFYAEYTSIRSEKLAETRWQHPDAGHAVRVGMKGDKFYVRMQYRSEKPRTCIWRDGVYLGVYAGHALIRPDPEGDLWIWWNYTDNLFLNVYKLMPPIQLMRQEDRPPEAEQPFLVEEISDHFSEYRVADTLDQVDGAWCYVVERQGADRIWLDPALGFAVRRRCLNWGPGLPISRVVVNSNFKEVKQGLWAPWTQTVELYPNPRDEDKKFWGKPAHRLTYAVSRLEFDSLTDGFFFIEIPSGTIVVDSIREMTYQTQSKDVEPFAEALAFAGQNRRSNSDRQSLWLGIALAACTLLLLELLRRLPLRNRKS